MRGPFRSPRLLALAAAPLVAACGTSRPAREGTPAPAPTCVVVDVAPGTQVAPGSRPASPSTLRVALPGPVSPAHAPAGTNDSERLVYRQLYQPLVEVDCEGRARPGLAETWSHDGGGARWRFTLRRDARFWDGSPVTARDLARAWASRSQQYGHQGSGPAIASAGVEGERDVAVLLTEPVNSVQAFARAAFAVTREPNGAGWPLGTGPFRPLSEGGEAPRGIQLLATAPGGVDAILFEPWPAGDARVALEAGADALVSLDPEVIAYARALPDFDVAPLPWSRTYVVAAPQEPWSGRAAPADRPPAEAMDGLARGAVRAEARPAEPPYWWTSSACAGTGVSKAKRDRAPFGVPVARSDRRPAARIAYPLGDGVARGIAERLVALARRGEALPSWLSSAVPGLRGAPGSVVAAGMEPAALAGAARRAELVAFVVPLPRAPGGPCLSRILAADDPVTEAVLAGGGGLRVTPLIDVRPSLMIRRGVAGVSVHGDGTLSFHREGSVR